MLVLLSVLLVFTGGASSYRVPGIIEELSENNFDAPNQGEKNYSHNDEAGKEDMLKRSDVSTSDPIEINEGKEIDYGVEQGDIKVSELMKNEEAQLKASGITKRNAQRDHRYLWTRKIIPYEIDDALQEHTSVITQSIAGFHQQTCLRFVAKDSSHTNYIKFVKKSGCWSYVGKQYHSEGPQEVSLGTGCEYTATIQHELMHALGFWHEQSRPDRDRYVEIYWEHIQQGKDYNFDRTQSNTADMLGVDYDYQSILHYKPKSFSKNGKFTLTAINDPNNSKNIGQGSGLTASDILKINTLYSCDACSSTVSLGAEHGGSLSSDKFSAPSNHFLEMYGPSHGRLNSGSAWCTNNENEYLQIDLGQEKKLCSVVTQGSGLYEDWVTTYTVRYSTDGNNWNQIQDNGAEKVYAGNTNKQTAVKHGLGSPLAARYVRFYPKQFNGVRCMRVALDGSAPFLSAWSTWTPCDRQSCKKKRQRFCSSDNKAVDCPTVNEHHVETEEISCTQAECTAPIHGHWGKWSSWGSCAACGLGTRTRSRVCDDPAPSFGGNNCTGSSSSSVQCRSKHCQMGPDGCSFTTGLCTWNESPFADIPWNRHQFSTGSPGTGPSGDTTGVDNSGYYIYLEASISGSHATGSKAILRSAVQPGQSSPRCLKFQYNMYDSYKKYMGTLNVKKQTAQNGDQMVLKTISNDQGNQWHTAEVPFSSPSDYLIIFEGVRGTSWSSDIAIDDVYLLWGPCSSATDVNPEPDTQPTHNTIEDSCDFESDFGTWQNSGSQDRQFDWTRHTGLTGTDQTGPSGDHTKRTGYYAYIETSSPRTIGQRARLISKTFTQDYRCMSMWYHMNGGNVWQLNVVKKTSSKETLLWSANKNEGDKWLHGIIPVAGSESFTIIIEAVRGHGETGDIAIDDLVVAKESCTTLKPSTSDPASKASCSFDGDNKECAWVDLPDGNMYWLSHGGSTPNANTGPASDHSGSGFYMYINSASPRQTGHKALIASPYVTPGGTGQCFKFWYHMYGSQVGSLNVYKENLSSSSRSNILSKASSQGNTWQMASVHVTGNEKFRIVLEGIVGGLGASDIAIDDVSFTAGAC